MMNRAEGELALPRSQMPPCTDTERVAYLCTFIPDEHLSGMKAATQVYGAFNYRAREVMLLLMLEAWTAAIDWVIDTYGGQDAKAEDEDGESEEVIAQPEAGSQDSPAEAGSAEGGTQPDVSGGEPPRAGITGGGVERYNVATGNKRDGKEGE